jgi:hypothetical protein
VRDGCVRLRAEGVVEVLLPPVQDPVEEAVEVGVVPEGR